MMGYLSKDRQTEDLNLESLMQFGQKLAMSVLDWFKVLDKHKLERIKRAVQLNQLRKPKRTIADIIGTEDFEEYKDEIDLEMKRLSQQESKTLEKKKIKKPKRQSKPYIPSKSDKEQPCLNIKFQPSEESEQSIESDQEPIQTQLMPTLISPQEEPLLLDIDMNNVGFDIPVMCGFEWYE